MPKEMGFYLYLLQKKLLMTFNCPLHKVGLKFNIGKLIKALFLKVGCQSQLLGKVAKTIAYMNIGYLLMIELYQRTILGSVG